MPLLTRRGHYVAIISMASILVGLTLGNEFIFFIGIAGASVLIYYFNWMRNFKDIFKSIDVERVEGTIHAIEGLEFEIGFNIYNESDKVIPRLVIVDSPSERVVCQDPVVEAQDIMPGEAIQLSYKAYTGVGSSFWNIINILVYDPLNLFVEMKDLKLPITVYGYPYPRISPEAVKHRPMGLSRILNIQSRMGLEFLELREYVYGDDYRMIHWPSTARYGDLVVKVNAVESLINITIVVDASREMWVGDPGLTPLDHAARISVWVAEIVSKYSGRLTLVIFDGYSYRVYRFHSKDVVTRVSTVFARLSPSRFRSTEDMLYTLRNISLERRGDIFILFTGPGVQWDTLINGLENYISPHHPTVFLGVGLPSGGTSEEELIRMYTVRELDRYFDELLYLRIGYGDSSRMASLLGEVLQRWI